MIYFLHSKNLTLKILKINIKNCNFSAHNLDGYFLGGLLTYVSLPLLKDFLK